MRKPHVPPTMRFITACRNEIATILPLAVSKSQQLPLLSAHWPSMCRGDNFTQSPRFAASHHYNHSHTTHTNNIGAHVFRRWLVDVEQAIASYFLTMV